MNFVEFLRIRTPLTIMIAIWYVFVNVVVFVVRGFHMAPRGGTWTLVDSILMGGVIVLGWSTSFGASLWNERDGHLDVAWTKPVSRTRYALSIFATDIAALAGIFVVAIAFTEFAARWGGVLAPGTIGAGDVALAVRLFLSAVAWFALMQAFSAASRSSSGIVLGPAWAVAMILMVAGSRSLGTPWHALFVALNAVNPMAYCADIWFTTTRTFALPLQTQLAPAIAYAALCAIIIIAGTCAIVRWKQVEA